MNKAAVTLLFLILGAFQKPVSVKVEATPGSFRVFAGKMLYESTYPYESTDKLESVLVFYINSQESFLFMKSLGATISNLGSPTEKIPVQSVALKLDKRDDQKAFFMNTIEIANADEDSLKNLYVKSIHKSPTQLHIFVGELDYYSLMRMAMDGPESAVIEMNKEAFAISGETFESLREGHQMPGISFYFDGKQLKTSGFIWSGDKSGLAIVAIKPSKFKSFRLTRGQDPKTQAMAVSCELLESNPSYGFSYIAPDKEHPKTFLFNSVSQEPFTESFECEGVTGVENFSIVKQGSERILIMSKIGKKDTLTLSADQIESFQTNKKAERDKLFDYSVLLTRVQGIVQLQAGANVDNRHIYFKIQRTGGKNTLELMTLSAKTNVIRKTIELPETQAKKLKFSFIFAAGDKVEMVNLKMMRSARMHTNLFGNDDFCSILSKPALIREDFVELPSDQKPADTGVFLRLADEKTQMIHWGTKIFHDKDGSLRVVIYDRKKAGFINIGEESLTLSYLNLFQYERNEKMLTNVIPLDSVKSLIAGLAPETTPSVTVSFYGKSGIMMPASFILDPSNPLEIFVNVNADTSALIKKNLRAKFTAFGPEKLALVLYPVENFVEASFQDKQLSLKYKQQQFSLELPEVESVDQAVTVYKQRGDCQVVPTLFLGNLPQHPEKVTLLIQVDKRNIKLQKAQAAKRAGDDFLLISLASFNSDGLSDVQLNTLEVAPGRKTCAIKSERDMRFLLSQSQLTFNDPARTRSLALSLSHLHKLQLFKTYEFSGQPKTLFHCFESTKKTALGASSCVVLAGFVNDLGNHFENLFFGAEANFFNRPMVSFQQEADNLKLDAKIEEGTLTVTLQGNKLAIEGEGLSFSATLSGPEVHVPETTKRFFKLRLHLFISDVEDITSELTFPADAGLSNEGIKAPGAAFKFALKTNKLQSYQDALRQILETNNFSFAAEIFENDKAELTLLVFEQNRFAANQLVNYSILKDRTYDFSDNKKPKNLSDKLKKMNPAFAKKMLQEIDLKTGEDKKIQVASLNAARPSRNGLCAEEQCIVAATFKGKAAGDFFIVTKAGELDAVTTSTKDVVLSDSPIETAVHGFPALEVTVQELLI